jgi:hypothetical protein
MVLAISTEDPTKTEWDPNLRCMVCPYFADRAWSDWCGNGPMRFKFPIIGHDFGPGGRLSFRPRQRMVRERRRRIVVASHAVMYKNQEEEE